MASFDDDTALRPAAAGCWEGEIVPGWQTPRGPLGGYVMAIMTRGLGLAVADDERAPRTVAMHFLRVPEEGPVQVQATVERQGRSLSTVSGRLEQDGKLIGLAIGAYSKPWEGPLLGAPPMPKVEPPDPPGTDHEGGRGSAPRPPFLERMVMEHRIGEMAFTTAGDGIVGGWLGLRERRAIDELTVAVLADAWFPSPWPRLAKFAPAPTIDLTIHFRSPLPAQGELLLGCFENELVRDGFFDESGKLWSPDGTLVAQSRQLGLLIGAEA
jgi:acyl-CoA thioesterase